MDEELYYINLRCLDCEFSSPQICKYCSPYILEDSQEGCVKQVLEDLKIEYEHQLQEVWPFAKTLQTEAAKRECYKDTINILNKVFNSSTKNLISKEGKIKLDKSK